MSNFQGRFYIDDNNVVYRNYCDIKDKGYFLKCTDIADNTIDRRIAPQDMPSIKQINHDKAYELINDFWKTVHPEWIYKNKKYHTIPMSYPYDQGNVLINVRQTIGGRQMCRYVEIYKLCWHQGKIFWLDVKSALNGRARIYRYVDENQSPIAGYGKITSITNLRFIVDDKNHIV